MRSIRSLVLMDVHLPPTYHRNAAFILNPERKFPSIANPRNSDEYSNKKIAAKI